MENRQLSNSGLHVSPVCLGTMTFGTPVGEAEAVEITRWALDNGVNFIDTANMYEGYLRYIGSPGGVAEEILGKALSGRRNRAILATKVGMKVGSASEDEGTSAAAIVLQIDKSLARLATDYIDIYYLHSPDPTVPLPEILSALQRLIEQGKIRYYGLSNYSAEQTSALLSVADDNNFPRPIIHQPPYSLLKPDAESDLFPLLERECISAAPYQVLQGGVLTGKYRRDAPLPEGSRKTEKPEWVLDLSNELFAQLESIEAEAHQNGHTLLEHTVKTTLAKPAVASLIVGVKRIDQLQRLVAAVD